MDQLIPTLVPLVDTFRDCFRAEVFQTFQTLIAGWIVCVGPRTISEVWQATGLAATRHHDTAYAVFRSACWEWDDLGIILATLILTHLVPGGVVCLDVFTQAHVKSNHASTSDDDIFGDFTTC